MKNLNRYFLIFFFITTPYLFGVDLRVLLLKNQPSVFIQSKSKINVTRNNNSHIIYIPKNKIIRLTATHDKIKVGLFGIFSSPLKLKTYKHPIKINDSLYRGTLLIFNINEKLMIINKINIEEYLYGVVPREISVTWSDNVIKAQTIVARTFALIQKFKTKNNLYDLDNSTYSQMYKGFNVENLHINKLIDDTVGEVVIYKHHLAETYYHSTCGGTTEDPKYVWGKAIPYLKTISCPYCHSSPHYSWSLTLTKEKIEHQLKSKGYSIKIMRLQTKKKDKSGRIVALNIIGRHKKLTLNGNKFRNIIGSKILKSTKFQIFNKKNTIKFIGHGWGHGIGMCQWGAKEMSDRNVNYKRILQYYYRGTQVVKFSFNLIQNQ